MPKPPLPGKPPLPPEPTGTVTLYVPPWESGIPGPQRAPHNNPEDDQTTGDWSHLSAKTMALRQMFVIEFVKDWSPKKAMQRMGWKTQHPAEMGNNWLNEDYTQYCLSKFLREAKEEALVTRGEIISYLVREANCFTLDGSGASRTTALRSLAKIMGMEIKKVQVDMPTPGVMFVPFMGGEDDWGAAASKMQADLKNGKHQTSAA